MPTVNELIAVGETDLSGASDYGGLRTLGKNHAAGCELVNCMANHPVPSAARQLIDDGEHADAECESGGIVLASQPLDTKIVCQCWGCEKAKERGIISALLRWMGFGERTTWTG